MRHLIESPASSLDFELVRLGKVVLVFAEKIGATVINTFAGCPGAGPDAKYPNWITCPWPPYFIEGIEWQWEKKVIPFWKEMAKRAKDAGVKLTGQVPVKVPKKRRSRLSFFPLILIFLFLMFGSRRRTGSWIFFLPLLMGGFGPRYGSGGFGGSFGGFGGGFGGFGGGMSGGGGAWRTF